MSKFDIEKFPESETAKRMLHRVSPIYNNSYVGKWLYEVMGREFDEARKLVMSLRDQIFTSTVTWGIDFQEDKYSLPHDTFLTLDERRLRLWRKRNSASPISPWMLENYILNAWDIKADVDETVANGIILLTISEDKENRLAAMYKALREIKPSHLSIYLIQKVYKLFILNRPGPTINVVSPQKITEEKKPYVVFTTGLNSSCGVETVRREEERMFTHCDHIFCSATMNGRIKTNSGGSFSVYSQTGKQVVKDRTGILNESIGITNVYKSKEVVRKSERRFVKQGYFLNFCGNTSVTFEDVGDDVKISEQIYTGCIMNGGVVKEHEEITNKTDRVSESVFTTQWKLNGRPIRAMNSCKSIRTTKECEGADKTTIKTFAGPLLNSRSFTNHGQRKSVIRTVHIPKWREVVKRDCGTLLNASKHETHFRTIINIVPEKIEKKFSPTKGALLNDRAVMGYLRL